MRTAPNELSFNSVGSWKDIYGFRQGHLPFIKSPFYDGGTFADQAHSIVSERDPVTHGKMRKYLSHAFSDRSLKEQEDLVSEVVDEFISRVGTNASGEEGANMVLWFNLTTFDVIGSLAFGQSFGGLKSGEQAWDPILEAFVKRSSTGKLHFWIQLVTTALRQGALADTMSRFPLFAKALTILMPSLIEKLTKDTKTHEAHTIDLIDRSALDLHG